MAQQHNKGTTLPSWMKIAGIILLVIAFIFMNLDYIQAKMFQLRDIVAGPLAQIGTWTLILTAGFLFLFKVFKK